MSSLCPVDGMHPRVAMNMDPHIFRPQHHITMSKGWTLPQATGLS